MKFFIAVSLAAAVFSGALVENARAADLLERANIILVVADDLRWDVLGFSGNQLIQTPHLDRLASRGVVFRKCRVTTSICCVSRASIFSGQYARRHEINEFATPFTDAQWRQTYPARLRAGGYRTGFIGKFGVGDNAYVRSREAEFDYWRGRPGQGGLFFDKNDPSQTHATARMGDEAIEFLRGCNPAQPFCLSLSFTAPHARDGEPREFTPDRRDESLYTGIEIPVPRTAAAEYFEKIPVPVRNSEGRRRWQPRFATPELFQRIVKDYYRLVTGIDREIGRLLAELESRGIAENTVIIFTSDNGFFFGERGLADKWFIYEESIRVPLIVFDPRAGDKDRGRAVDAMVLNIDLAPTILEIARLENSAGIQGHSLLPWLREATTPVTWRSEFFYEHHTVPRLVPPSEGVVTERWKYLNWINQPPPNEELYDMVTDPLETENLALAPENAATLAGLRTHWEKLRAELR